jgi:DNA-binding transcriptional ArsR family regulator
VSAKARGLQELEDLDLVFSALAHRSRRTILSILKARGGEMTSGAIAARFDCSWPTTTRHLRVLEEAGLVRVELQSRERVYRLDTARLAKVAGSWLSRFAE